MRRPRVHALPGSTTWHTSTLPLRQLEVMVAPKKGERKAAELTHGPVSAPPLEASCIRRAAPRSTVSLLPSMDLPAAKVDPLASSLRRSRAWGVLSYHDFEQSARPPVLRGMAVLSRGLPVKMNMGRMVGGHGYDCLEQEQHGGSVEDDHDLKVVMPLTPLLFATTQIRPCVPPVCAYSPRWLRGAGYCGLYSLTPSIAAQASLNFRQTAV